jgi:SAM-dependent methyltransferase
MTTHRHEHANRGMSVLCRCQNQGVVSLDGLHGERDRAESFGSAAEQYDRYRPGYPSALIDELLSLRPVNALDVGCGTGKVAMSLMGRGVPVLGVEPDARMAEVARRHHVPVEVASFESWEPAGRTYDLLTAGHSWHWVDPVIGLAKAASIVVPGGTVALFWNYHVLDEALLAAFDDAYRAHASELTVVGRDPSENGAQDRDPFEGSPDFISLGNRIYRWPRTLDADEWTAMLGTFSDHARLGEPRLPDLQLALRKAIERAGGGVRSRCGTCVWMARRVEKTVDRD